MPDRVSFGLFEFDAADGTLTREGVEVRLQPQPARVLAIGATLEADYIALAQMKRDETGVRLIAHLIRVSDQGHLWDTCDRRAFTLDVQAEIAESIASQVARCLTHGCSTPLT